jgi:hypothetical protein
MQMKITILSYFLYKLSGEAIALGMLGLYEALPRILLALPAGYQVERMEKRKALAIVISSYELFPIKSGYINRGSLYKCLPYGSYWQYGDGGLCSIIFSYYSKR